METSVFHKRSEESPFVVCDGKHIHSISELYQMLDEMSDDSFAHHVGSGRNDFASWISGVFSEQKLADSIVSLQQKEDIQKAIRDWFAAHLQEKYSFSKPSQPAVKPIEPAPPKHEEVAEPSPQPKPAPQQVAPAEKKESPKVQKPSAPAQAAPSSVSITHSESVFSHPDQSKPAEVQPSQAPEQTTEQQSQPASAPKKDSAVSTSLKELISSLDPNSKKEAKTEKRKIKSLFSRKPKQDAQQEPTKEADTKSKSLSSNPPKMDMLDKVIYFVSGLIVGALVVYFMP